MRYQDFQPQPKAFAELLYTLAKDAQVYELPTNGYLASGDVEASFYHAEDWSLLPEPVVILHYSIENGEHSETSADRIILAFETSASAIPSEFLHALNQSHPDIERYQGICIVSFAQSSKLDSASCAITPMMGIFPRKATTTTPNLHLIGLFDDQIQQGIDQLGKDNYLYDISTDLQFSLRNLSHWLATGISHIDKEY